MVISEGTPLIYKAALAGISDKAIRRGFIAKVFGILAAQLAVTAVIAAIIMLCGQELFRAMGPVMTVVFLIIVLLTPMAILCIFMCNPKQTKEKYPTNMILLAVFTVAQGFAVGLVSASYSVATVLISLSVTSLVCVTLMIFAFCTKTDFTGLGPYLFVALLVLCFFGFIIWCVSLFELGSEPGQYYGRSPALQTANLIYAALGTLLFSLFIVYDTQMVIGGVEHKEQYSIDDYVMAAIDLYLDIVNMFFSMLQLLGGHQSQSGLADDDSGF